MYKERREKASIKFYILIALVILIIVFAIILVMPKNKKVTKKTVPTELYSKSDLVSINKSYSDIFYDNLKNFKDTSEKYFIKKVDALGNKEIITLDNLINENHMMATLLDKDGNKCDEVNSNVTFIKNSNNDNYKMTLTLICGSENATLTTYMGNYDYCKNNKYCEKKVEVKKQATKVEEPVTESVETPTEITVPDTPVQTDYSLYEYVLSPSESVGTYSDWSEWSTTEEQASLYKQIETKTETQTSEYDCSIHENQRYIAGYKEETYIAGYTTKTTKVGTKNENGNIVAVYDTKTTPVYGTRKVPVYGYRRIDNDKTCTKEDAVTYYRYRIFTYKKGINYIRYSSSDNDSYLINKGYVKTENTK